MRGAWAWHSAKTGRGSAVYSSEKGSKTMEGKAETSCRRHKTATRDLRTGPPHQPRKGPGANASGVEAARIALPHNPLYSLGNRKSRRIRLRRPPAPPGPRPGGERWCSPAAQSLDFRPATSRCSQTPRSRRRILFHDLFRRSAVKKRHASTCHRDAIGGAGGGALQVELEAAAYPSTPRDRTSGRRHTALPA